MCSKCYATKETSKTKTHFGTAEKKLLILLCYYVLLGSEALVAFALNAKSIGAFVNAVIMYFICESSGIDTSGKCESQMKAYESLNNVGLSILVYVLFSGPSTSCESSLCRGGSRGGGGGGGGAPGARAHPSVHLIIYSCYVIVALHC